MSAYGIVLKAPDQAPRDITLTEADFRDLSDWIAARLVGRIVPEQIIEFMLSRGWRFNHCYSDIISFRRGDPPIQIPICIRPARENYVRWQSRVLGYLADAMEKSLGEIFQKISAVSPVSGLSGFPMAGLSTAIAHEDWEAIVREVHARDEAFRP